MILKPVFFGLGMLIILVGASTFLNHYPAYQYGLTSAGKIARAIDPNYNIQFQNFQNAVYGSAGVVILGLILTASSLIMKETPEEKLPEAPKVIPLDDALEIARMRFARGEITAEEYEEIKRGLA